MTEYRLPTAEGRELLIRPCIDERTRLNVAILSRRGNIIESLTIELSDVPALTRGLARLARVANATAEQAVQAARVAARCRYRAALARNPWQTLSRVELKRRGLV